MKSIYFAERARLRAEITATNLWNRANYSLPDANIANVGTVGVISGVGGTATLDGSGPRTFRAGLRFEW
jgi:hypothetical protein